MSFQHPGSKIFVVPHKSGKFLKDDIIGIYLSIVDALNPREEQAHRVTSDLHRLTQLDDKSNYYMIIRRRSGETSDYSKVLLREYGLLGRYEPSFVSELMVWDVEKARLINAGLVDPEPGSAEE